MTKIIHIDFETRSTTDIKSGIENYSKTAEVLCLAYGETLWTPDMQPPASLIEHVKNGGLIGAHNAMFEYVIWNNVCVPKYGWPDIKLEQLRDTMAQCAMCNIPQSLDNASTALGLRERKDKRGVYLINHLCVPRKPTEGNPSIWFEEPELLQELYEYCLQDVKVESEIYDKLPKLSDYEQQVWEMTQRINLRGVPVDMALISQVNSMMDQHKAELEKQSMDLLGFSVTQAAKLTEYLGTDNVQAATIEEELKTATGRRKEALILRKALSTTATAKFKKIPEIVCSDNTVKHTTIYHGAGTGRFASRGGLNTQNFSRPTIDQGTALKVIQSNDLEFIRSMGEPMEFFSSVTRAIIHGDFMDADFSSVENRVASWLAEDVKSLMLFKSGLDQYKDMATVMYHVDYKSVTKSQRQVAKSAVLGSMYGQGPKGYVSFAEGYGVKITLDEAEEIVAAYRTTYKKIVNLWYRMNDCAIEAVRTKKMVKVNKHLAFKTDANFLRLRLPSGRGLFFYKPKVESLETPWGEMKDVVTAMGLNTYTRKFERIKLIGSSLFQSAVQGTARDLLVNSMFTLEHWGVKIRNTIHDEILADRHPDIELDQFCDLMCGAPEWAEDLPLDAEGWVGDRYQK